MAFSSPAAPGCGGGVWMKNGSAPAAANTRPRRMRAMRAAIFIFVDSPRAIMGPWSVGSCCETTGHPGDIASPDLDDSYDGRHFAFILPVDVEPALFE